MDRGFYSIMSAQFLSSLADNALLIAAIALLAQMNAPDWMTPLLKLFFVISYIVLAAYVGIFADSMPKGRVMLITNMLKIAGCLLMLFGSHPLLAYAIVGVGAAAYSPAKYGILTELLPPVKLVLANSWIEGLTVASIILGVVLGGILISDTVSCMILASGIPFEALGIATPAQAAIAIIVFIYMGAAFVNLLIPDTGARYPKADFRPIETLKSFYKSCTILWADRLGQISLAVTTLFWGAGAVLQFLVLKWSEYALGMNLSEGCILQAVVSIGIAVGAVLAAQLVSLKNSLKVLWMGVIMGVLVTCCAYFNQSMVPDVCVSIFGFDVGLAELIASLIMITVGICAGFFVVPMNALLHHRGYVLMSAGRSIAVQNFNENSSILVMLGIYAVLIHWDLSVPATMVIFGVFVTASMLAVIAKHFINQREYDSTHLIGEDKRH